MRQSALKNLKLVNEKKIAMNLFSCRNISIKNIRQFSVEKIYVLKLLAIGDTLWFITTAMEVWLFMGKLFCFG